MIGFRDKANRNRRPKDVLPWVAEVLADEQWHTNPELAARMLGEWNKIEPYKAKGFIADWP